MHTSVFRLILSAVALLTSVRCSVRLKEHNEHQILSSNTIELLSSFKQCIVFIFDWALQNQYDYTSFTNYVIFYSKSISCSMVVETWTMSRNRTAQNPRFTSWYKPHPLFTKHTTVLTNLYSSGATSIDRDREPTAGYIYEVMRKYNIPFNYVLLFMSKPRFTSMDNRAMFIKCIDVSAPAVYILVLDDKDVHVVGFAHVLKLVPYFFRVDVIQESHIQNLHEAIHKDLKRATVLVLANEIPAPCTLDSSIHPPYDCAFSTLVEYFNATHCNKHVSSCTSAVISDIGTNQPLIFMKAFTRRDDFQMELVNYVTSSNEFNFVCIVQTGKMGLMAFLQAFNPSTWVITAAACMFLTVTTAAISNHKDVSVRKKLEQSAVVVIMLLFERFYVNAQLERAASRQTILVLTLWAFGAMLLGMSYSGNMISELTSPSLPSVPQDMHELSLVEHPVFTVTATNIYENGTYHTLGYFQHEIDAYLENNQEQTGPLAQDLKRLSSIMAFYNVITIPVIESDSSESSKVIFAIADGTVETKALGFGSLLTKDRLRAVSGGILPFFNTVSLMAVHANPLMPIFRKYLAKLCEPGICTYWEGNSSAEAFEKAFLYRLVPSNPILGLKWEIRAKLARIWRNFSPLLDGTSSWRPIAVSNLTPAFQLLGIGLMVSSLVALNERWSLRVAVCLLLRKSHDVLTEICRAIKRFGTWMYTVGQRAKGAW